MSPEAVKLSPKERLKLIPPPRELPTTTLHEESKIEIVRLGVEHKSDHQPGSPEIDYLPYTVEQELDICRRYLQDFICFDYPIPSSCVKYAKEVY